jgi:hypothetical protein
MTIAVRRKQQVVLLWHGLVLASGVNHRRSDDASRYRPNFKSCYFDIRNSSRKI